MVLGWGAAVLLQLAHPLVAAGVADHSGFRASPGERFHRFRRTLRAMLSLTYDSPEPAQQAAERIDAIHGRVHGVLREREGVFPAGTRYSARDPELLCWVQATLVDTTLRTYRQFVGPMSRAEQDRYCAEATGSGRLFGIPNGMLPASTDQLGDYLGGMFRSGQICVGPTARALAQELLGAEGGLASLVEMPLSLPYRLVTVGLLPPSIRQAYGLRWGPANELGYFAAAAASRRLLVLLPDAVRRWPEARAAARGVIRHPEPAPSRRQYTGSIPSTSPRSRPTPASRARP